MTTSDSEAFESADEDLNDETSIKTKSNKTSVFKECKEKQSKSESAGEQFAHGSDAQKSIQKREVTSTIKQGTILLAKEDSSQSESTENKQEQQISNQTDEGWEDFDVEDDLDVDQDFKDEKPDDRRKNAVEKKVESKNEQEDEGWEFDDWGDEDVQSHVAPKSDVIRSEKEFKDLADKLSSLGNQGAKTTEEQSGWGGWGGWGASMLSSGVSQLTTHVSQGFNTVSNVIETGMGAPNPEELVRIQKESQEKRDERLKKGLSEEGNIQTVSESAKEEMKDEISENAGGFRFGKLVSSVTKLVETTGTTVITGGLDTLEEIGKRTMKVIQGDEPGGRVKLSTLLREAKDRKEEQDTDIVGGNIVKKKLPRFEVLFDDYQGLVHLEALEMLSKQCDIKIQTLMSKCQDKELKELQETLEQVKEICELPDMDDEPENKHDTESFKQQLDDATKDMGVQLNFDSIINCWQDIFNDTDKPLESAELANEIVKNLEVKIENISHLAIRKIAQYSALSVQLLHKCAALLSVRERRSTADEADGLTQLTATLSHNIGEIANVFSNKLNELSKQSENTNETTGGMTNIYLEAEKGSSYIKDAFLLTIPILQVGAT